MAHKIAFYIPVPVIEKISEGVLSTKDRFLLSESSLSVERQDEITQRFEKLVQTSNTQCFAFKLHFRKFKGIGKALALPGGDIVITDALLDINDNSYPIVGVPLHEIGHVLERHGLQQMIRASTVSDIVTIALGDACDLSDLTLGIPMMLLQSNYSRNAERHADEYAFARMIELNIDPMCFATIINVLSNSANGKSMDTKSDEQSDKENSADDVLWDENVECKKLSDYLASHPQTAARAKRAMEMSTQYRNSDAAKADQ